MVSADGRNVTICSFIVLLFCIMMANVIHGCNTFGRIVVDLCPFLSLCITVELLAV